jgi:hypothetical protein
MTVVARPAAVALMVAWRTVVTWVVVLVVPSVAPSLLLLVATVSAEPNLLFPLGFHLSCRLARGVLTCVLQLLTP